MALASYERGPFDVFVRLRSLIGFTHDTNGLPAGWPDTNLARMVACPWCLSVWVAPVVWAAWQLEPALVVITAASTLAIVAERWNNSG